MYPWLGYRDRMGEDRLHAMSMGGVSPHLGPEIRCRETQSAQLSAFVNPGSPCVPVIVVHGQAATGKTLVVSRLLSALDSPSAIIDSHECITGRHLLERTVAVTKEALEQADFGPFDGIDGRCESLSALTVQISQLLERCPRFYLVFDGVDNQREAAPTLLAALARLGELIPCLTVILIVKYPSPLFLHKSGVPHIEFSPYNKTASISIISQNPLPIFAASTASDIDEDPQHRLTEDDLWLWQRFCGIVWDALGRGAARDLVHFRTMCERLWLPFVQPIRDGIVRPKELSKLVNRTRGLFQGEEALRESIVPLSGLVVEERKRIFRNSQELSYFSKYLLIAAYLASHNPPRTDSIFFMKMHEKKKRKSKKSVASVTSVAASSAASARPMKHRKVQRRLLGAQPFMLERLLAIFHAIVPEQAPAGSADILTQVATLVALRLLTKTVGSADVTDGATKWRVNVGWEYIQGLSRGVRFEVEEFLVD